MSFASFPLDDLPLSRQQKEVCQKAGFNFSSDVLLISMGDVAKKTKLRYADAQSLVGAISKALTPRSWTVAELVDRRETEQGVDEGEGTQRAEGWSSTGDKGLDQLLGGGLKIGCLTEITGESAAGKSHLCMSLSVAAQLPSLSPHPGGVIVLTSEREISTDRLIQLAKHLLSTFPAPGLAVKHVLADIHTMRCAEVDDLENALKYQVPGMLASRRSSNHSPLLGEPAGLSTVRDPTHVRQKPIKLLLLDSITALLRGSDALSSSSTSASSLAQRSKFLCSIADKLKALAVEYEIAVVVINQVTDVFSRPVPIPPPSLVSSASQFYTATGPDVPMLYATQARWFSGQTETLAKEASLGIVWANAVNTRLMLSRTGRRRRINQDDMLVMGKGQGVGEVEDGEDTWADVRPTLIRRAHVVFSSHAPCATLDFVITSTGVHSLEQSYSLVDTGGSSSRKRRRRSVDSDSAPIGDVGHTGDSEYGSRRRWRGEEVIDDFGDLPAEFWDEAPSSPIKDPGAVT